MSCGMVRKVDELGRVVIPKEMRRILNIKTGSSIEMFINDENQVVLKKFSELSNVQAFAESLADIIFDNFNLPCLISDDEKIIVCKGLNKKEFLNLKISNDLEINEKNKLNLSKDNNFLNKCTYEHVYVFKVTSEGFESGLVFLLSDKEINDETVKSIDLLSKFLSSLLKF